jgi:histidinol-phosphate aminotransferase
MAMEFAEKVRRIPVYPAADGYASEGPVAKLASNESPYPPIPAVIEAVTKALTALNRYPDPTNAALRRRLGDLHGVPAQRIAVGNGSCDILLAAGDALLEPGAELVYAWPSFSMYPHLAALSGAREIRVPLREDGTHDLEAMLAEVTAATQILLVCNPNNPTATHIPATEIAAFLESVPDHVTVILDEAYAEFQLHDDPDSGADLTRKFANLMVLRTFSKVYGLAGLRCGYAICAPKLRAAVDAVRQPFSVSLISQAAAAEAIRHQDDVDRRIEQTIAERIHVESGLQELELETTESHANFSWISLGHREEDEVVRRLGQAGVIVRPGDGLGGPGHIRVSYGTRDENEHFLTALRDAIA